MLGYRVYVNGKRLFDAGVGTDGVLTAVLSYTTSPGADSGPKPVMLHVGGISGSSHVKWSDDSAEFGPSDSVTVEVVELEDPDPPREVEPPKPQQNPPTTEDPFCCAFCGRPKDQVGALVMGPVVSICERCIETCRKMAGELMSGTDAT